jgi:hypothetical protein
MPEFTCTYGRTVMGMAGVVIFSESDKLSRICYWEYEFIYAKFSFPLKVRELSHHAKQHPTASTRNDLNNVNKLGCAQLLMHFVAVRNQQLEVSMVTINNNQSIKAELSTPRACA